MDRRPGNMGMRTCFVMRGCANAVSDNPVGSVPNNQHIPLRICDVGVTNHTPGCECKDPRAGKCIQGGVEIRMYCHIRKIVVVQACATQVLFLQVEPQWPGQVQVSPCSCAHADGVTSVRWDAGLVEDNVRKWHVQDVTGMGMRAIMGA